MVSLVGIRVVSVGKIRLVNLCCYIATSTCLPPITVKVVGQI